MTCVNANLLKSVNHNSYKTGKYMIIVTITNFSFNSVNETNLNLLKVSFLNLQQMNQSKL